MTVAPGDRFTVFAPKEVRSPKGRLLARLLPDMDYRVTPANLKLVQDMIATREARAGGRAPGGPKNQTAAKPVRVSGRARTARARKSNPA